MGQIGLDLGCTHGGRVPPAGGTVVATDVRDFTILSGNTESRAMDTALSEYLAMVIGNHRGVSPLVH